MNALVLTALVCGQSPDPAKFAPVRDAMERYVSQNDISGAVTCVGRASGTLSTIAVGKRDITANAAMTPDTVFRIASMTKPITAIAIMILADEGKLAVTDPVAKHLPEFTGQLMVASRTEGVISLKKPARPITLADLLTHTSGLPGAYPPGLNDVYAKRNRTLAETTIAISQQPLQFEPGSKWAYCNAGIDTLGRVVEVVSGMSYDQFLKARIFDPLGMTDTTPYPTPAMIDRLAVTYAKKDGRLVAEPNPFLNYAKNAKHPIPAGGLFSTAADLAKLYRMMLHRGQLDGKRILSEKAVADMTAVHTGDLTAGFVPGGAFGYGWAVVTKPQRVTQSLTAGTFGHGGAFGTQGWVDPTQDLFVILLIQRIGLANSDASPMRKDLQDLAVAAVK